MFPSFALQRQEEEYLRELEESNLREDWAREPSAADDFERLLMSKGDSSIVWIKYIAHHLKMSELQKARDVAERAVQHINFR
jgi:rRNA biogenesis protein RRP5